MITWYKIVMSTREKHSVTEAEAMRILQSSEDTEVTTTPDGKIIGINKAFIVDISPDDEKNAEEKKLEEKRQILARQKEFYKNKDK